MANRHSAPVRVVEPRKGPTGLFRPRVIALTVIDPGTNDGACGRTPLFIRGYDKGLSALVLYLELRDQRDIAPIDIAKTSVPPEAPSVPPVSQPGANGIFAFRNQPRDVICEVPQP